MLSGLSAGDSGVGGPVERQVMRKVCKLPDGWHLVSRDERGSEAAALLMKYLGSLENAKFRLVDEPDKTERRRRAADFLFQAEGPGRTVAVEFTEFTDEAVAEASALLRRGRRIAPREGVRPIESEGKQWGLMGPARSYPQHLPVLDKFVAEKIWKGQLQATDAGERILLFTTPRLCRRGRFSDIDIAAVSPERNGMKSITPL